MLVVRVVGLVAVLSSLVACADDTNEPEKTSESTSHLSDPGGGMGDDIPMPELPPGPWNDPDWQPPAPIERGLDTRPVGGECGVAYQKIWDPGRSKYIEVPISLCQ